MQNSSKITASTNINPPHRRLRIARALLILSALFSASAADGDADTIPAVFFSHEKRSFKSIDSLAAALFGDSGKPQLTMPPGMISNANASDGGNLTVTGYKSFGVSIGELGEVNLEQGLEAEISGEIRPGTALRAKLSDQGSSLDGSTREISEFDMMFIELTNKNFTVTAGDQFALWPKDGILSAQKKIVGISAEVRPKGRLSVSAFGSFSGGNHTVQTVRGRDGAQGPYYLTGDGSANIVTPIEGTVRARLNGKDLSEGASEDFTVDYDIGAVTFNPRVLVCQDDFIRIEYEYKSFDYRRTFAGGGAAFHAKDSAFSISGAVWSESDDKNHPVEMQLSSREVEMLKNSGGDPAACVSSTARPVHPLDVAKMSVYYPLYKKAYDGAAQDTILVYAPYDPLKPEDTHGFHTARFTRIQAGAAGADYVIDTAVGRGQFVYRYAGAGLGDHTALAPLPAPMRESAGEIIARLKLPYVNASLNLVGKEVDRNLFSEMGDGSNLSSAAMFTLSAGERRVDKRALWADFDYRYRSRAFSNEVFSVDERKEGWDVDGISGGADGADIVDKSEGRQFQSWESTVGGAVMKGAALNVGAGQSFVDSLAETEKASVDAEAHFVPDKLKLDIGAALFKHRLSDIDFSHRRHGKLFARPSPKWEAALEYKDEWRKDTSGRGGGHFSGTLEAAYLPAKLLQSFNFTQYARGDGLLESADTGYAVTWSQSAAAAPLDRWKLTGDSRWRHTKINGQGSASTFLMSAASEVESTKKSGLSSRQEYRVNQELASRFEQKMFYIGKGLGTHAYDSAAGEFRPSVNGDYIVQEVEIYDNTSLMPVRKTVLSGDWHFRPIKKISGILGDLSWSGVLSLEEHVDSRNGSAASYIPGLMSIFSGDNGGAPSSISTMPIASTISTSQIVTTAATASTVLTESSLSTEPPAIVPPYPNYSDLSYRQDIDYNVQGSPYKSRLYLLPSLRIVRGYREPAFDMGLLVERKKNRLLLSVEPRYLSVSRENLPSSRSGQQGEFGLSDASAELIQSVGQGGRFEFYIRERGGRIFDSGKNRAAAPSIPLDSGVYMQIRPGILHRPAKGGAAELSYTFSYVPYAGEMDYRMAGGQSRGTSHIVAFVSDVDAGKHFSLSGMYRGELTRKPEEKMFAPMTHVFSLQVKAFL
ncbi:MAG: DUF2460 domain-containing protein [Chitinispirillales bacterium]|jgi:hypothetical protein|nr:DUF2460 domain-containing protein [Chitinispirillales bacterium]